MIFIEKNFQTNIPYMYIEEQLYHVLSYKDIKNATSTKTYFR